MVGDEIDQAKTLLAETAYGCHDRPCHAVALHSKPIHLLVVHIAMRRWAAGGCRTAARLVVAGTLYAVCTRHAVASL